MPLIDITRPLHNGFPAWPDDVPFRRDTTVKLLGDRRCRTSSLAMSAHAGTHIDAPQHLAPQGAPARTVEALALAALIGPARVVDLRGKRVIAAEEIRSSRSGVLDARTRIHALGECPPRVLLRTDNSERDFSVDAFVAMTEDAAALLLGRSCVLVGIDGPSVDLPQATGLPVHRLLLDAGVAVLEGLDLGRAAPGDYELICLPLALEGSDGAPARAVLRTH
jgi:arylformamidase